jgi:hypothetical protein
MDFLPDKSSLPILNLDVELNERNNVSIAFLVLISGLIRYPDSRQKILERVKLEYINVPFPRYLYAVIAFELIRTKTVDIQSVIDQIPQFGPILYGEPSNEISMKGHYFTLAQVLYFQPTIANLSKAIDMVVAYAKKRGIAPVLDE